MAATMPSPQRQPHPPKLHRLKQQLPTKTQVEKREKSLYFD
jgi:hypothetical protein